jgi:hypothetical protein
VGFFLLYFIVVYVWSGTVNISKHIFLSLFVFVILSDWIAMGAGAGAGILIGLLLFFFPTIALFIVAIIIGIFLGILIYDVALIYTGWPYAYFVCVGVGAIILPLIAICIKKVRVLSARCLFSHFVAFQPFIIVITSFYGSLCIAFGVNFFLPVQYLPMYIDPSAPVVQPLWQTWVFLAGIVVGTILGIILQACLIS